MDKRIIKSLIDKNTEEFSYNPQIVINDRFKSILQRIKENLARADKVDIAISYVVWSGLALIKEELLKLNSDSRILVTTEGFVTDPTSLEFLNKLSVTVKVYNPHELKTKGFHLKTYCFSKDEHKTILIGSNNISARAFGLAHEMMVEIDSHNNGYIVSEYERVFEELWNDPISEPLTEKLIETYKTRFSEYKERREKIHEHILETEEIIPNVMQEEALSKLLEIRDQGADRGLVIAATGTGKTFLSAFDIRNMKAKRVLFLVHNRLILNDTMAAYKKIFPNEEIVELKGKMRLNKAARFIFTTDKTAGKHLVNQIDDDYFDYIIYDEAHRIGDTTLYQKIISYFRPTFTLGITATPERTKDTKFLFEVFEYNIPYEIRLLDALNNELICPFTYYGLNVDNNLLLSDEQFDYSQLAIYIKKQISEKRHYGEKLKALLFANNIKEASAINAALREIGFKSELAVSRTTKQTDIEQYITALKSNDLGTTEIICTVNQLNEGVDIPDINLIIMLRNTQSSIIYLQQLGRGLRRTSDPDKFVTVFDLIGNSNNNYSIAQVLTGNETADKRALYAQLAQSFVTVSPFINVSIEPQAIENILRSISNNFTVSTILRAKFREEFARFKYIPTLVEIYRNPYLHEIDLFQLLAKSFYEAFSKEYEHKYEVPQNNLFLRHFFRLISQFIFRGYSRKELIDYHKLLSGVEVENDILHKILMPQHFKDGRPSAINSEYNKAAHNLPEVFLLDNKKIKLNKEVLEHLAKFNALPLFYEHVELIAELAKRDNYVMQSLELVDKGEFLFNVGARDCYMTGVGERIDHEQKVVYCTINVTKEESNYDNYLISNKLLVYHTQNTQTEKGSIEKIRRFINEGYEFRICAKFPHLGYSQTAYFNLGKVTLQAVSDVKKRGQRQYNNEITFLLEKPLPPEFLMY